LSGDGRYVAVEVAELSVELRESEEEGGAVLGDVAVDYIIKYY